MRKDDLKINEEYAEKFTYMKKREALEKAKQKFGKDFMHAEESEESDDQSEDSEGEMINEKVMTKFIETYIKLKDDNAVKHFLVNKDPVFNDEDFVTEKNKKKKEEKIMYSVNDALLNFKEEKAPEDNIYSLEYQPKKEEINDPHKNDFLKQLGEDNNNLNASEADYVDDGFLTINKNSSIVIVDDTKTEPKENVVEEELENLDLDKVMNKAKIKPKNLDTDLLNKIWGDDKNLDKNEKFLRNYILSEAWLENDENKINKRLLLIDREDEEKDEQFDEYENKYNHRFEEEGGANLTTYQRNIPDSYRLKDNTRVQKRKQREIRKEEETNKIKSQLQIAKDIKKEEIKKKIAVIEQIAGTDRIKEIVDELEDEFDPEKFDEKMNKIFNEEYYGHRDNAEEITHAIEEKTFDYKTEKEETEQEAYAEEEYQNEEEYAEGNFENQEEEPENEWFFCDECKKPIKENKIKYECEKCEDYIVCKECFKSVNHSHIMKKTKVPVGCKPPENWNELVEAAKAEVVEDSLTCNNCSSDIINNYYFICPEESCANLKFCRTCRGIGKSIHEHKLSKYLLPVEEVEEKVDAKEKLSSLVESVFNPYTDKIIAKEIPTKFHYTKVEKDDLGITDEMLLYIDDRTLNKFLPLRKLAPYKEKVIMNDWQKKQMLKEFTREVERKKTEMSRLDQQNKDNIKRTTKLLSNKRKHVAEDSVEDYKKKKRLETYGLE